ncbi:MAG: flavodoxin family protein [Thermoplasmatota archaeon]
MKALVVYYSFGGLTKEIAEAVAEGSNADLLELKTDRRIDSGNFLDYSWGKTKNRIFHILPFDEDPSDYDLIFIGSPVWAWAPAPPIYAFLDRNPIMDKNVAFFTTSEGDPGNSSGKFREIIGENRIVGHVDFMIPPDSNMAVLKKKASNWADSIVKSIK